MKKLFAFLFVAVLLTGCGADEKKTDKTEETMDEVTEEYIDEVIEESRESSRIRSIEAYAKAVETTVTTYMTLNPDSVAGADFICSSACSDKCTIDATPAVRDKGEPSEGCSNAKKAVPYYGSAVKCESASYNNETGLVTLAGCTVGDDTKNVYSGNTIEGFKKVK